MQRDMHYYATYCAAFLAGYSHEESLAIGYSSQFVDVCSETLVKKVGGPLSGITMQLSAEMMQSETDILGLQNITRIWASFHFLPGDLYAEPGRGGRRYKRKYRLICDVNSDLLVKTVELARNRSLQAAGVAMHILADTWAHRYFAGTPSLVINDASSDFYECSAGPDGEIYEKLTLHTINVGKDSPEKHCYRVCPYTPSENSIMNLGHGRLGHLPDYSYLRYCYTPAWGNYRIIDKNNPEDYYMSFGQMVYALKCLRNGEPFEKDRYDEEAFRVYGDEIRGIINKRQLINCEGWQQLGERLSGQKIPEFDVERYQEEFMAADEESKGKTFLGRFFRAAMMQKSMVTGEIFESGSNLAGLYVKKGEKYHAVEDYIKLFKNKLRGRVK